MSAWISGPWHTRQSTTNTRANRVTVGCLGTSLAQSFASRSPGVLRVTFQRREQETAVHSQASRIYDPVFLPHARFSEAPPWSTQWPVLWVAAINRADTQLRQA